VLDVQDHAGRRGDLAEVAGAEPNVAECLERHFQQGVALLTAGPQANGAGGFHGGIDMPRPERQLDPGGGVVGEFAAQLRQLRESAGRPGYRELARQAHFSATALSEAAGGRRLPSLAVTLAFAAVCGADVEEWEKRWRAARAQLMRPESDELHQPNGTRPPYRGLAPYEAADAEWFFGRAQLLDELLRRLAGRRFLAVFGSSGSGKSSLLRAGLLPAAAQGRLPPRHLVLTMLMTPGERPMEELAVQLASLAGVPVGTLLTDLRAEPGLHLVARQVLAGHGPDAELLVIVDQFEEVFRLCSDAAERAAFVSALVSAVRADRSRVRVVLGARADFYARCAEHPDLVDAMRDAQMLMVPMSAPDLREAITGPAGHAGLTVEGNLVSVIVAEATGRPGALPLVSHALLEAWRRRRGMAVTLAAYQEAGGVDGAIAQTAERVYAGLDDRARQVVRGALLRLVDVTEGVEAGRRRVELSEFDLADPATVVVLRQLADARLITLGDNTVEMAHEALIRAWPRLANWIAEDREYLRLHRQLTEATGIWLALERDAGALYRGTRLMNAREWAARFATRMTPREREFLDASVNARGRELSAGRRRVRAALIGLAAGVTVASVLAGWALTESSQARDERNIAFSRQVAAEARGELEVDPELAVLLAERARAVRPTREADAVLRQAVVDSRSRTVMSGHDGPVYAVAFSADGRSLITANDDGTARVSPIGGGPPIVFRGHRGRVWGVAVSPDGRHMVTGGEDRTIRLWDWSYPGRSTILGTHDATVRNVVYSPDGTKVASASDDGTVRIWDLAHRGAAVVLRGHDGPVLGVAYSPDGRQLASSGNDRTIRLWPVAGGGPVTVLRGHQASVEYIVFSADGRHLASASTDGTARVWPMGGGDPLVLRGHDGTVEAVAFSPDGRQVATTGNDRTVRLWSSSSASHPRILRGHKGTVWAASFSPDGRQVASASDDGTARIWDASLTGDPAVLYGHVGSVWCAAFSADGRYVVTGGHDRTVRVWDTAGARPPVVLTGHQDEVTSVDISRDGSRVASASLDGTVRIWDWAGGGDPIVLRGHEGPVMQVGYAPDGRSVASGGADGTIRVWPVDGREQPVILRGQQGAVRMSFSADGSRLASAGWDATVRIWRWASGGRPVVLRGHQGPVWAASFSPDGQRVVSAGSDGTVRVWSADGSGQPLVLGAHQGVAWSAQFSGDGRLVVSAGSDGTARIWQADGGSEPVVFAGFGSSVESIAISAGDQRLLTAHGDGTVRIWHCPVCGPVSDVLRTARAHVTRALTPDERRVFLNEPAG
jgi:WD40 repeat protein